MKCGSQMLYELKVVREPTGYRVSVPLQSAEDVFRLLAERFKRLDREEFIVILSDNKNKMLEFNVVSTGSLTASIVHPREVFKPAILANAAPTSETRSTTGCAANSSRRWKPPTGMRKCASASCAEQGRVFLLDTTSHRTR